MGIYFDKASGRKRGKRKQFEQMLSDCRDGKIDLILAKSISRFARNTLDMLICLNKLRTLGIDPNFGFDEVFGAREHNVEFMPDLGEEIKFSLADGSVKDIPGGLFQQSYTLCGGEILGSYSDDRVASVTQSFGKGTAILMGTFPSEAYYRMASGKVLDLFKALLDRIGIRQRIFVEGASLTVRLCKGNSDHYVWVLNHTSVPVSATVTIMGFSKCGEQFWGEDSIQVDDGCFKLTVPAKDALVYRILV